MNFIIDGNYNKELITEISEKNLPVSHIIVHVPKNPLGNGSVLLPQEFPSFEEFEEYTKLVQENGYIPIAGLDSTCQGNLEAHIDQYQAIISMLQELIDLGYTHFLVSSPNNVGLINEQFPSVDIYLSYSQYITSLNRARIFSDIGVDVITLHPDIIRDFSALENFHKLGSTSGKTTQLEYILPLNLGCNWGCIQWYQHHNIQSHRTISSSVFSDQEKLSNVEHAYDYPMLYCWKKRLQNPKNLLKTGWIAPNNIEMYEDLGYNRFLLFANGFSTKKVIKILDSYNNKTLDTDFSEFLNFPHPYGDYWPKEKVLKAMFSLKPTLIEDFCNNFPYHTHYPFESDINEYCAGYVKNYKSENETKKELIELIDQKMKQLEKGAIER